MKWKEQLRLNLISIHVLLAKNRATEEAAEAGDVESNLHHEPFDEQAVQQMLRDPKAAANLLRQRLRDLQGAMSYIDVSASILRDRNIMKYGWMSLDDICEIRLEAHVQRVELVMFSSP